MRENASACQPSSRITPHASRITPHERRAIFETPATMTNSTFKLDWLILPLFGALVVLMLWSLSSATWAKELPSPSKTWAASKGYVLKPFEKRGEMDQGIGRFTWYSLLLVAKGYALALIIGTPIGFMLGLSKMFTKTFDPIIQ